MTDITREQLLEAMAKAIKDDDGQPYRIRKDPFECDAAVALTAIEALGLKIVPYYPTHEMEAVFYSENYSPRGIYQAMLSASPLYRDEEK